MMSERATKHYTISPSTGHLQISSLVDRDTMLLDTVVLRIVATDKGQAIGHKIPLTLYNTDFTDCLH